MTTTTVDGRQDVTFASADAECSGWYYPAAGAAPAAPAIAMAHGFTGVKEMELDHFARAFAAAGLSVLLFDYRGFGTSGGARRQHLDPRAQLDDYRSALSWLAAHPDVDAGRLGVWGTSYSGGHVLHLAAFDRRIKAVVSQVPFVDGLPTAMRVLGAERFAEVRAALGAERNRAYVEGEPAYIPVVSAEGGAAAIPQSGTTSHLLAAAELAPSWENRITFESLERLIEYSPGAMIERISPTPLLMILAGEDTLTPTDLALTAYNRALEPKALHFVHVGQHHGVYEEPARSDALAAATDWLTTHLCD